jgi:hypothetical protein
MFSDYEPDKLPTTKFYHKTLKKNLIPELIKIFSLFSTHLIIFKSNFFTIESNQK